MTRAIRGMPGRLASALLAGLMLAWVIGACGSSTAGTVSQQVKQAASGAASQVKSASSQAGDPTTSKTTSKDTSTVSKTATVTQSAQASTATRTETSTSTQRQGPTIVNQTTGVKIATTPEHSESSSGLPWWAWALIILGVVGVGAALFQAGRHRNRRRPGPGAPGAPPPPSASPSPPASPPPPGQRPSAG